MKKYILTLISLIVLSSPLFVLSSCGDDDDVPSGNLDKGNVNANAVGTDNSVARLEMPHIDTRYDYICHRLSDGTVNYTILYDKTKFHPVWVAYTYDSKSAQRNWTSRTDAWRGDPFYDSNKQYQLDINTFPGYQRGHIVGSAERYYSREANEQTFYMTNMSPMNGAFNGDYWGEVEDKVRDNWGRAVTDSKSQFYNGTLYVVKGGTIDKEENIIEYINLRNTKGNTVRMAVPRYYWMAVLFVSKSGSARAIGFWMEHKDYRLNINDASAMQNLRRGAACSIDELEARTGIDFFCNLLDGAENAVEKSYDINNWPGL